MAVGNVGNKTLEAMQAVALDNIQELTAEQQTSKQSFIRDLEEAVNPFAARFQTRQKEIKNRKKVQKSLEAGEKTRRLSPITKVDKDKADEYQRRNPELEAKTLLNLLKTIRQLKPDATSEDILKELQNIYPDVSLADEALDFLIESSEGEIHEKMVEAKESMNKTFGREIAAGRNIGNIARQASQKGMGAPTTMRDMYRDITGNPRDSVTLFEELSQKYAYKDLQKVVSFLLHSLGADMKARGPSIPRGLLHRLFTETRSLQAILGVYHFFKGRMNLVQNLFQKNDIPIPQQISFESLSKLFMGIAADRYPSSAKVLQSASRLGIEKWLMAKIIVLSQIRDAIREVAVHKIYRSLQHRDELLMTLIEALEELEDELEEMEERQEQEERQQEGEESEEESEE